MGRSAPALTSFSPAIVLSTEPFRAFRLAYALVTHPSPGCD